MSHALDIIPGTEWGFFTLPRPMCIAGPCSAESEGQVMETARGLNEFGIHVYRAGIWKPRTHPGSFEGVGTPGLKWLKKVKEAYGMKVCTEVASEKHVLECIKYGVDMVWIGARTSANPFLMQEIADALEGTDMPVLVKNPVNPDIDLWIGALERLNRAGLRKLGVIHRGFSTQDSIPYRNDPSWNMAMKLRSLYPQMAFFADPSHMAGDRKYLQELSQKAMDLGLDGLMIESHCNPDIAMSDSKQQLTPVALKDLLEKLVIRDNPVDDSYKEGLDALRARIDIIDDNLLKLLSERNRVSRSIGEFKRSHSMEVVQQGRWDALLADMMARATRMGVSQATVKAIMEAIHKESVNVQNGIVE